MYNYEMDPYEYVTPAVYKWNQIGPAININFTIWIGVSQLKFKSVFDLYETYYDGHAFSHGSVNLGLHI